MKRTLAARTAESSERSNAERRSVCGSTLAAEPSALHRSRSASIYDCSTARRWPPNLQRLFIAFQLYFVSCKKIEELRMENNPTMFEKRLKRRSEATENVWSFSRVLWDIILMYLSLCLRACSSTNLCVADREERSCFTFLKSSSPFCCWLSSCVLAATLSWGSPGEKVAVLDDNSAPGTNCSCISDEPAGVRLNTCTIRIWKWNSQNKNSDRK